MNRREFLMGLAATTALGTLPRLAIGQPKYDADEWVVNHESLLDADIRAMWCHMGRGVIRRNKPEVIPIPPGHEILAMNAGSSLHPEAKVVKVCLLRGRTKIIEIVMNTQSFFCWHSPALEPIHGIDRLEVRLVTGTSAFFGAFATTRKL